MPVYSTTNVKLYQEVAIPAGSTKAILPLSHSITIALYVDTTTALKEESNATMK